MKKILLLLLAALCGLALCVSCANGSDDETKISLDKTPGTIGEFPGSLKAASAASSVIQTSVSDVIFFYYRPDGNYSGWDLYVWVDGGSGDTAGSFTTVTQNGLKLGYVNLSAATTLPSGVSNVIKNKGIVNFIVRQGGSLWAAKDPDGDRKFDLSVSNRYLSISGDSGVYPVQDTLVPSISGASMIDKSHMKVNLSVEYALEGNASDNGFTMTSSDGSTITVSDVKTYAGKDSSDRTHNFSSELYAELASDIDFSKEWFVKNDKFVPASGCAVVTSNAGKNSIKDLKYDGNDLGLTFNADKTANFKVWAPLASSVSLIMFSDKSKLENPLDSTSKASDPDKTAVMTFASDTGVWSAEKVDVTGYKYYKYRITNAGVTHDVCDIYAKAASYEAAAGQITDINSDTNAVYAGTKDTTWGTQAGYYNPFGNSGTTAESYSDAVVYEMHIRDWSRLEVTDSTGKFLDIANGSKVIAHLKDLGITHVQILPAFEWGIYNTESAADNSAYNWGYNPYQYNVPESRYVTDVNTNDGTKAVQDFRTLIAKLHEAGIAVNMDVVYNHTSGTGTGSLFDMTVPYYYYRLTSDGKYSNGSGCGNETDSGAPMYRKFMIDSLKHWMLDYHINGFRFDLMGLHEVETMKAVYEALYAIDPNVMVYGEPWSGGTTPVVNGVTKSKIDLCSPSASVNGVACFNDEIRNAIKGSEYPSFTSGEVSGVNCSVALNRHFSGTLYTAKIGRLINYVECHDNLTLSDKLALVMNGKTAPADGNWVGVTGETRDGVVYQGKETELKSRDELAAGYMFLAQGTPFINGGQEFLRSKKGNSNSYASVDDINEIKQTYITAYTDVTSYYKGLIALRKAYPESFGRCESVEVKNLGTTGLVQKYSAGDFVVFFNAGTASYTIGSDSVAGNVVNISAGSVDIAGEVTTPSDIPALSTVIVKVK